MTVMIKASDIAKTFTLHNQGGATLRVFSGVNFEVAKGEAVVLAGPSGAGKTSLLKLLYANYRPTSGRIEVNHAGHMVDIVSATPRRMLEIRRRTLGFVSQFLRVIPRVSTIDIVRDPMLARGIDPKVATRRAGDILHRLNLPQRLWPLAPATFSGGEQQRVNIARSLVEPPPILLVDEPTASLDASNRDIVVELLREARMRGATIIGIFHDDAVRARVATRHLSMSEFTQAP